MREPNFARIGGGTEALGKTSPETWAFAPYVATAFR